MRLAPLLLVFLPALLPGQLTQDVQVTTLTNGLKILVQEDHRIPTVALYFFFRVGSRDERPGITGISHFFEHMMFNGSAKYGPGEFDRQMEREGGSNNAYTTRDTTVYTDWFPPDALELMMSMESDRMAHMTFDPKLIDSERGVVYSERRLRTDNSSRGTLEEQVTSAAIIAHPYHWPVVGWAADIEAWTLSDLESYYKEGYAPNNCVMVAVGDVTNKQVTDLATRYFGPIPSHETFAEPRTKEPVQQGERIVNVRKEAELPLLTMVFHMPETKSPDNAPIQVLEAVLAAGDSSRLYSTLVDREQAALNVSVFDEPSLNPYLLQVFIQPRAGIDISKVQQLAIGELDKIQREPISNTELQKAKNRWLADHFREMKTVAGRANQLGVYEVYTGSYKNLDVEPDQIARVSAADVQRVAKSVLAAENRTTGILTPEKAATAAPSN